MNKSFLFVVLATGFLVQPLRARPTLKVSTDFEGGSAKIIDIDLQTKTIRFTPGGDANRGWVC